MTTSNDPVAVGVPEIVPELSWFVNTVSPGGNVEPSAGTQVHVYGVFPPEAVKEAEYGVPATAGGGAADVIDSCVGCDASGVVEKVLAPLQPVSSATSISIGMNVTDRSMLITSSRPWSPLSLRDSRLFPSHAKLTPPAGKLHVQLIRRNQAHN